MTKPSTPATLDTGRILAQLDHAPCALDVEVIGQCASTNTELAAEKPPPPGHMHVLVARHQTAGRGRRGRRWQSRADASLTFSCAWPWLDNPAKSPPTTLPLAAGLAVSQALQNLNVATQLKWPNDILVDGRKLAGILVELQKHSTGATAIIGCGLNLRDAPATPHGSLDAVSLDQLGADLSDINRILACILTRLHYNLREINELGFGDLREQWKRHDAFAGKAVIVHDENMITQGICRGIDLTGALQLQTSDGIRRILSGDVSLRSAA